MELFITEFIVVNIFNNLSIHLFITCLYVIFYIQFHVQMLSIEYHIKLIKCTNTNLYLVFYSILCNTVTIIM